MVLRDVSTGAIETRISNLRNQKTKINKNSLKMEHKTEETKLMVRNH